MNLKDIHYCPSGKEISVGRNIDNDTICVHCEKKVDYYSHFPDRDKCKLSAPSVVFGGSYRCETCGKLHELKQKGVR